MATITLSGPVPDPTLTWELRAHVAERDNIRLLAAVREAKAALEPFAAVAEDVDDCGGDDEGMCPDDERAEDASDEAITIGHCRRARTALARLGELGCE